MTCGCQGAIGDTSGWWRTYASPSDVYVWRVGVTGLVASAPDDALAVLRAASRSPNLLLDARGICLSVNAEGSGRVDVVFTIREYAMNTNVLALWPNAAEVAAIVLADDATRARSPKLALSEPEWLQLTAPPASVDFWKAAPVLWDRMLGPNWQGGPTQAFANRDGVYIGVSDEGPGLKPWTTGKKPGLGPGDKKNGGGGSSWVPLVGVGLLLGILLFTSRGQAGEGTKFWARARARRREPL